jgi:hypothetical protein
VNKRILALLLAAVLLLAVGCGESEKILSTEGVPQEVLQSAQYKAALAEETATVIAYNYVPLTDSAPLRAAVEKMQAGEDAELRYYNFHDRNDIQGIAGVRLTVKDGVAAFQEISLTGYDGTVDWENVLYQQAGEIELNSCGYLSFAEGIDYTYRVFSPLDPYEDYNKRYELTKTYLEPLEEGCRQNFTSPEGITDPLWWARLCWFLTDGETDYPEGHEVPIDKIEEVLLKWFDISEEKLRSLLDPDGNGTMLWVTETGISWSCFAKEAVREGDLLRIRYGFTFNGREPNYNRELTVRIAEDGSWKYVSNRTVPAELENGVTAMSIDGMLSGSGWQPLYTCMVQEGDGYNEVFSTTMSPRLLADGTMAIPVIRGDYEDGKTIAVVLLRLDGSYTAVETPLTCGGWMRNVFDNTIGRDTGTEATRESIIIRTEYSQNVGTVFGYYQPTRVVETEVWSDGRLESRDYVPEGSRYTMLKSPDGQHIADATGNGSLTIDGVTVIETGLDREIWEYDRYYRPELWLDNDRLVISSNYYRYSNDYGIFTLSTGEVTWMNLGKMNGNGNGLSGIRLLDGKLCWTAREVFFTDDESGSVSEMAFYSLPVEELPYGTPTRMATKLYYGMEHNGRLWTAETNYTATGHLTVRAFDPESGESAELDIPVAEWLDGVEQSRSWLCNAYKMTEQGMVLRGTQYMENDNYGTDWIILVPHALLDNMEWQRLPSVLDSAEEIPLTEIEEVFGGQWRDMEYGDGYTLTIYREGDALYCRWADMEPQQLVKAYKTGKTGYYITTRRADGTTDALALDTGKPKDNKITAMLYEWRNLTYQGEA